MPATGSVLRPLLLALCLAALTSAQSHDGFTRFHVKKDRPQTITSNRRTFDTALPRHEPGFDPDVLNRFLEEYANKLKRGTTERSPLDDDSKLEHDGQELETGDSGEKNATNVLSEMSTLNDTVKRHKFYNANSQEDRNNGWVTLDAIPWSKSKISKWQANPTTQGPWPDSKPWDKPSYNKPGYNSDFPRPSNYESSSKPWQNKKPHWSDNSPAASSKPWYSDRPRPLQQDRPSYPAIDKYEDNPNQAQKWPPERPSWDRYGDSSRPSDIITDNGPPNFPSGSNWERPAQRPSYTHHTESYMSEHGGGSGWHDRNDFPSGNGNNNNNNNNNYGRPGDDNSGGYYDRPNFSHYKYPASSHDRPPNHPSSGDGQWVLLSTNRGYSKSRQRSIKLDALLSAARAGNNGSQNGGEKKQTSGDNEEEVPAVTSKRQVRLTVLPSINGTNTTTSHGGMLEVERTFKTVDQSQKEYEMEKTSASASTTRNQTARPHQARPLAGTVLLNRRPIRNTLAGGGAPSNTAVLAAVGAGMLPATMAMMIPMMLGKRRRRRRRSVEGEEVVRYLRVPKEVLEAQRRMGM